MEKGERNRTMESVLTKNKRGYGYCYTDLAQIHEYLETNNMKYYQYIERIDNEDYVMTVKIIDGKEQQALRGCRVVNATLSGKSNPAQEQGSALTYARRYSLLMAFGLATDDDDAECLTRKTIDSKFETVLRNVIAKNNIPNEEVIKVINQYGYTRLNEIEITNYKKICDELGGNK